MTSSRSDNAWQDELDFFSLPKATTILQSLTPTSKLTPEGVYYHESSPGKSSSSSAIENEQQKKRKAAVAAASRATRAKRKQELQDLKLKNERLQAEKEGYLNKIAELQMQVQANREAGSIDLAMENELLRAELQEHKSFIALFKNVADGVPTTSNAKRVICIQGADTAIAQLMGLLSTSMVDPSWKKGKIRPYPMVRLLYQRLPHGSKCDEATRISLRCDVPFVIPRQPDELAKIFWKIFCDEDLSTRISNHFGSVSKSIKEVDTGIGSLDLGDKQDIKVFYYKEQRNVPKDDCKKRSPKNKSRTGLESYETVNTDTLFLITSKEIDVPLSSFPDITGDGSKRSTKAFIVVTTSTQHSSDIKPEEPGVHRIKSVLLEGAVMRPVPGGTKLTKILSYPLKTSQVDASSFMSEQTASGWVDDDGYLTPVCENVAKDLVSIIAEDQKLDANKLFSSYKSQA